MLDWAHLLAPHFGPTGSMDLDLRDWPSARGPSYYNQFSHYAFLQLATGAVPGCPASDRERYRDLALRNIEYALAITDAEFHTPHFSRGREWGRHVGEWLNYYLLCSLELMERHGLGTPELRARLAAAVSGAVDVLHRRFEERYRVAPKEFVGNHDTWHGLLFFRAGRFFHRADWMDYARDFFARCVLPFQHADGYWPEAQGIVVGYSLVTAQAVSVYGELSGDAAARSSIGRFMGFFEFSCLPDGTMAVTLDVRMRYYAMPFLFCAPGFMGSESGRRLVGQMLQAGRSYLNTHGVRDNGAQACAFFASFAEFAFVPEIQPPEIQVQAPATLPAARLVDGPWRGYLGWQIVPEHPSRFVLDTQNFVELWHREAGYLAGTGGSRFMPRFSTVRRTNGGRAYIPDRARCLRVTSTQAEVAYTFGEDDVAVKLVLVGGKCNVSARLGRAVVGHAYEFALLVAFKNGELVGFDEAEEKIEPTVLVHWQGCPRPVRTLRWRGLVWTLPEGTRVDYPLVPHNSYTQDGLPAADDYVGRISFPLTQDEQTLSIS
ncbi:MAG: hypothetical protein KA257_05270 [Opitutaceae bacterium]|nr:hypothetical protein [Opitutaceae bacterium]MBP9912918.1 hypothetical protein [Opitutaceae bacterium]